MIVRLPLPHVFDVGLVRAVAPGIVSVVKGKKGLPICEVKVSTD